MKTSAVLASLLFGSFAVAAPVDRRALVYKTEIVTETVVVFTTVYDDDEPVAQATTTPAGYFYEQPAAPSSAAAQPTTSSQAPAYTPPAAEKPSSTYVAPAPQTPAPAPSSAPVVESPAPIETPKPIETPQPVETPKPVETPQPAPTSAAYVAPAPAPVASPAPVYSAAPAPVPSAPASGSPSGGAMDYQNVDITIYDNNGGLGACGTPINDGDMIVALAKDAWGASTYNVMTGAATNPWCGQQIDIEYNGNHVTATIMDLCPGCSGHDIDLSLSAWKKLTGLDEKTRLKASWSKKSN